MRGTRKKPKWREVRDPKPDICYWCVIDYALEIVHFFRTKEEAFEYSSFHNIPDVNIYQECDG